jgi:hypothetical protein
MGCGREVVGKVGVREGGMPTVGERRAVAKVACVGLEEGLRAWAGDEAFLQELGSRNWRLTRPAPSKVGERREAVGSGTDGRRVGSSKEKRGSGT